MNFFELYTPRQSNDPDFKNCPKCTFELDATQTHCFNCGHYQAESKITLRGLPWIEIRQIVIWSIVGLSFGGFLITTLLFEKYFRFFEIWAGWFSGLFMIVSWLITRADYKDSVSPQSIWLNTLSGLILGLTVPGLILAGLDFLVRLIPGSYQNWVEYVFFIILSFVAWIVGYMFAEFVENYWLYRHQINYQTLISYELQIDNKIEEVSQTLLELEKYKKNLSNKTILNQFANTINLLHQERCVQVILKWKIWLIRTSNRLQALSRNLENLTVPEIQERSAAILDLENRLMGKLQEWKKSLQKNPNSKGEEIVKEASLLLDLFTNLRESLLIRQGVVLLENTSVLHLHSQLPLDSLNRQSPSLFESLHIRTNLAITDLKNQLDQEHARIKEEVSILQFLGSETKRPTHI